MRFLSRKNKIPYCCDAEALAALRFNCRDEGISNALAQRCIGTFPELSDIVSRYCVMKNAWLAEKEQRDLIQGLSDSDDRRMRSSRCPKCPRADKRVNQPARKKKQSEQGPMSALDAILDEPFAIRSVSWNRNPTHKLRACWVVRRVAKGWINLLDNLGTQKSQGKTLSWEEQIVRR